MIDQSQFHHAAIGSAPAWPLTIGLIPDPADGFSSRPETGYGLAATTTIDELHLPGGTGDRVGALVLAGPDGAGKTQLAAAVARGLLAGGSVDLVLWISAGTPSSVLSGYGSALRHLSLAAPGMPIDDAAARFLEWLADTDRPWLAVLDDVADPGALARLWPAGPAGLLVLTCRAGVDLADLASLPDPRVHLIGGFSPREALSYLAARLYADTDQRAQALDMAKDLEGMPLALAMATAAISGTSLSCRDYRRRFAERRQELAGRVADRFATPAEIAWSLALDRADQRRPVGVARPALAITALLDPGGVPGQVVTSTAAREFMASRAGSPIDQAQAWAAVGSLAQSALVSLRGSMVAVNPVVRAAVRDLVPPAVLGIAAQVAAAAIAEIWPGHAADSDIASELRECVVSLRESSGDALWTPEPHPLLEQAGVSMDQAGLGWSAMTHWHAMLATSSRLLGPEHIRTLTLRGRLAESCERAGRHDDAVELYLGVVTERERVLGPDHPDTLTARINLAGAYRAAGHYQQAIDLLTTAVSGREWVLGQDHPDTIAARSLLARTCLRAGQTDGAITAYQRNVADSERTLGINHVETLAERVNLATAYQAAGQFDDAIAVLRRVVAMRERILGADHADTLSASAQLGFAYRTAGRLKDALPYYRATVTGRAATLGPDHPDTLLAIANLAACLQSARRLKEAIPLFEQVVNARERIQGPNHKDTLTARGNLAAAYHSAGRLANALPEYERTLAGFERSLGQYHKDTLTSRGNLAHAYYMAKRQAEAAALFERTLADCERVLGPEHELTKIISENYRASLR